MQMVEVLVNYVGVFVQEVVQCLHDEADAVSIQLSAQELWKYLRSRGGQHVGTGRHVPAAASYI